MSLKTLLRSFAGGEIAPELYGRMDLVKNQTGLARCQNFWVLPQGPAQNRPGFEFVNEVKDSSKKVFLMEFSFSAEQTLVIEAGAGYMRFHQNGLTVLESDKAITALTQASPGVFTSAAHGYGDGDWIFIYGDADHSPIVGPGGLNGLFYKVANATANTYTLTDLAGNAISTAALPAYVSGGVTGRVYEIATPYAEDDLFGLHYVQSADVVTIVHPDHPVQELRRHGEADWELTPATFAAGVTPPQNVAVARIPVNVSLAARSYVVLARYEKSGAPGTYVYSNPLSSNATGYNDLTAPGAKNTLTWTPVSGKPYASLTSSYDFKDYVVVQRSGFSYKQLGSATTNPTFDDTNLTPGATIAPPPPVPALMPWPEAPALVQVRATIGTTPDTNTYAVTALDADGRESVISASVSVYNDLSASGAYNTVSWDALLAGADTAAAAFYNVYKQSNGLLGYIGQTNGLSFIDDNIVPDLGSTPPLHREPFNSADNYPGAVGYFEQRKVFGGTNSQPQNVWMTRSATENDLNYHQPQLDDDSIAFKIASGEVSTVRHIVPFGALALLTSGAEFRVTPQNSDALTPTNVSVRPDSYEGASKVQPVLTGSGVLFAAARGGRVRELRYSWESQGYTTRDVSVLAPQLFDGYAITDLASVKAPGKMVWAVRSDGALLGLTYLPEQEVLAWHRHATLNGSFESVAAVAEGSEDSLYAVVRRPIDGRDVRLIERLRSRRFNEPAGAFFVDCGLTYDDVPASVIGGLRHLEGQTVSILADGAVLPQQTVSGGRITLDEPAGVVHVGLPITAELQTLPLALEAEALGQGTHKNVNKVHLRLDRSSNVFAGPGFDDLSLLKQRTTEPYGSPPQLLTGEYPLLIKGRWGADGSVCLRNTDPLPVTLLGLTLEVAMGG